MNYLNSVNVWVQKETVVCSFNVENIAKCKQNNACFIRKGLKIKACPSDFKRISINNNNNDLDKVTYFSAYPGCRL